MKQVCVIGNSHVSMLLTANRSQQFGLELTCFAKPKLSPSDLEIDGSVISSQSSSMLEWLERFGTPSEIDLAAFEAVIVVALSTSIFPATRIAQFHAITGWPSQSEKLSARLALQRRQPGQPLMTRDTYRSILVALNYGSLGYQVVKKLRTVSDVPVYVIAQPFPSSQIRRIRDDYPVMNKVIDRGDGDALATDLVLAHRQSFQEIKNVTYIAQQQETIVDGCLSRTDFMLGARRLDIRQRQPKNDVMHANAELGSCFLKGVSAHLSFS